MRGINGWRGFTFNHLEQPANVGVAQVLHDLDLAEAIEIDLGLLDRLDDDLHGRERGVV
jgi:hypothetical protein